jgi:hypothetical protein
MLEQAKQNSSDYPVFIANLDSFVTQARSVTAIMLKEFASINGFKEWYDEKLKDNSFKSDFNYFNKLRVDTTHIRPFNAGSKYTTSFQDGMTISGGKTAEIPLGKADDRGNLIIDNKTPVSINGKPATDIKRLTTRNYFFTDKPNEDAIARCEAYIQKLKELVTGCQDHFNIL